jgi:transcriptional regulator with XRE-family HTH domain
MLEDKKTLSKSIGENIKQFRTLNKISQEELAHRCGFNRAYIGYLEAGYKTPSILSLYKIAIELKTTVSKLTNGI